MPKKLYKTVAVIWSDFDPSGRMELSDLARDSESGDSYCSKQGTVLVEDPSKDADWDGTEFFGVEDEDDEEEEDE